MKKSATLLLFLFATLCFAKTRDWKTAAVLSVSETNVSGPLIRETSTVHYIVETDDFVLMLDYSYHPKGTAPPTDPHSKNAPPSIAVSGVTKVAIEGKTAYILDTTGSEVKMHIVKKTKK
ncbi:MAG: hypothetical protein ABSH39_00540 [Candidatus Acidiferrum sp.]|jgi:hypothetical protein